MISLYHAGSSWIHRQRAGYKLLALCALSGSFFYVESLPVIGGLAVLTLIAYASLGEGGLVQTKAVLALWPWLLFMWAFHALNGDVYLGAVVASKMLVMVLLANLLTLSTRQTDLLAAIQWALQPLNKIGVSTRPFALAISLMISYLPVLLHVFELHQQAWRARGGAKRGRWRLMVPALLSALALAERAGEALAARGGVRGLR